MKVKIRCNQNKIFGCGRSDDYPAETYVVGIDRVRVQAGGRCACGLPLAVVRDATSAERRKIAGAA